MDSTFKFGIYIRDAIIGKTGKTVVLPGFSAGKTWSYLDFQKKFEVLTRKRNQIFPFYFCYNERAYNFFIQCTHKIKAINQWKKDENLKFLNFLPYLIEIFENTS